MLSHRSIPQIAGLNARTLSVGASVLASTSSQLLTLAVWARNLQVEEFGFLALALAVLAYGFVLADFGTTRSLVIASAQGDEQIAADTVQLKWILAGVTAAATLAILTALLPISIAIVLIVGEACLWGVQGRISYLRGKGTIWPFLLASTLNWPSVLSLSLLMQPLTPLTITIAFTIPRVVIAAILFANPKPLRASADFRGLASALRKAVPHGFVTASNSALLYLPVFGAGLCFSALELGWFQAAWKLVGASALISMPISILAFPDLARSATADYQALARQSLHLLLLLGFLGALLAGTCALMPGPLLGLVFGADFVSGQRFLLTLCPLLLLRLLFLVPDTILAVTGNQSIALRQPAFWMLAFIITGTAGFLALGPEGYLISYVGSYAGLVLSLLLSVRRILQGEARASAAR